MTAERRQCPEETPDAGVSSCRPAGLLGRPAALLGDLTVGGEAPVRLMGVINVSPESFYPHSVHLDGPLLRDAAQRAVADGADVLDVGAMSTAPYLDTVVSEEEERRRLTWALEIVADSVSIPISADTARANVAAAALACGASILNDVSGLRGDDAMARVARGAAGMVLMASPGAGFPRGGGAAARGGTGAPPARAAPSVKDGPIACVHSSLRDSLAIAAAAGLDLRRIVIDPGVGFFTGEDIDPVRWNATLLHGLGALTDLGRPILIGVSRKSFLGRITGRAKPAERLAASLAATAVAVYNGAALVRTHDIAATRDTVRVAAALRDGSFATSRMV